MRVSGSVVIVPTFVSVRVLDTISIPMDQEENDVADVDPILHDPHLDPEGTA